MAAVAYDLYSRAHKFKISLSLKLLQGDVKDVANYVTVHEKKKKKNIVCVFRFVVFFSLCGVWRPQNVYFFFVLFIFSSSLGSLSPF